MAEPTARSGISVIVCTYNGAERLGGTLQHLVQQMIPCRINWEVIVVNNASNDDSKMVATRYSGDFLLKEISYSIIDQPKAGLAFARQAGIKKSTFEYLLFCDDDNWLHSDYVINAYEILENNSRIGALGGMSTAVSDLPHFPDWFPKVESWYAVGKQAMIEGDISHTYNLWGAGMITRRTLYQDCHPINFPLLLSGRSGPALTAGEDTEYCLRLLLGGYELHYSEALRFTHFIQGNRLTKQYRDGLKQGFENAHHEIVKYYQLYLLINKGKVRQLTIFMRMLAAYLSTFFGRRSWHGSDVIRALYFVTEVDLGVDHNSKKIYNYYKSLGRNIK